ncbi:putative Late nodulin [Medicago truncatula]|uniref:Nodule Cysteine-Rich (NCR) secreted peptide n=1 Tax=Medicago truncatula TaxID=3880 RepID=A0A072U8J4_MEDTR|nr:Nodule Cysteine-Rich (NCR) secreted peptide [Medicago truncatula]RHN74409.1 putative Late nodulin [Medicago truncatula]
MAAIIKFIYTMFLFIFLFVVPTKVDALAGCITDADCVIKKCSSSCRIKCIDFRCLCPTGF